MDGYDLIEKVRELSAACGGRIPAVALTAYAGFEDRMRVLSSGYQEHIPKPIEPAELEIVVESLAERYAVPLAP
jgi:CheY-like chemotaxis protein